MKRSLFAVFVLSAVGTAFAAYQYIISGIPVSDPSESACSATVSIDARVASDQALATAMETRCKTSDSRVCAEAVDLSSPGISFLIR